MFVSISSPSVQAAMAGAALAGLSALIVLGMLGAGAQRASIDDAVQHADAVAAQLARLSVGALVTNNMIELNVIAGRLAEHPATASVRILSVDDRVLAAAGRLTQDAAVAAGNAVSVHAITFDGAAIGEARVAADSAAFLRAGVASLRALALLVVVSLGALAGWLAGRWLQSVLDVVARSLPELDAPDARVGGGALTALVRHAQAVMARAEAAAQAEPGSGYLIVVNVFNQIELAGSDRERVLGDALTAVQALPPWPGAQVCLLPGTGVLLALPELPEAADSAAAVALGLDAVRAVEGINGQRRLAGRVEVQVRGAVALTEHLPLLFDSVDPVKALGEPLSRAIVHSAAVRDSMLCVTHEVFELLDSTEEMTFTAVRAPFDATERRFVYQVSAVRTAPTRSEPITGPRG